MFKPGNQEWRKRQVMTEALRIELIQFESPEVKMGEAPRKVARKAIEAALKGEPWALAFVFERMDGKAQQTVNQNVDIRVMESVSDEQARLMAEAFIESARAGAGVCPEEPGGVHDSVPTGLPSGEPASPDSERATKG